MLNLPPLPSSPEKKPAVSMGINNSLNTPTTSSAALALIKAPLPAKVSKKCEYDGPYCKEFGTMPELENHKLLWHSNYVPTVCERCFQRFCLKSLNCVLQFEFLRFKNIDELKDHKVVCPGHPPGYDSPQPTEIIPRR